MRRDDDEYSEHFPVSDDPLRALLLRWRRNCLRSQIANYDAANWFAKTNYWIGIPTIILAAGIATGVFATLQMQPAMWAKITVGLSGFLASILAALHTFLQLQERSSKHQATGVGYGSLKREIDLLLATNQLGESINHAKVELIGKRMEALAANAPGMPERLWVLIHRKVPPDEK